MINSHRPRLARAVVAAASGVALAATLGLPAAAAPDTDDAPGASQALTGKALEGVKVSGPLATARGQVSVYVRFAGEGAFEQTQPDAVAEGKRKPVKAKERVKEIRRAIEKKGKSAASQADADVIYTTTNTIPGVALRGDAEALRALAQRPDVVEISAIVPKKPTNKGAVIDTDTLEAWQSLGETGDGVTIAVLDTGVDYTHADFGGPGTVEAYERAQASTALPSADSGLRDPSKFIGGWDLVGDDYNADPSSPSFQPVPRPDANPLDCATAGHGTHVAGSAAGYGVDADGGTFTGDYSSLTAEQVGDMRVGPGTAPEAQLVGIRVFGCAGSSSVVGQALDFVLDPNRDGDFSDRADVVNMSLGSDHSPVDDPENAIVNELARQGVLSVVASGNASDVTDVGGGPGNAASALTVANSIGSQITLTGVEVLAPAGLAGTEAGQYSVNFDYAAATEEQLTGEVVMAPADNAFGCDPFTTDLAGKWVWLQWENESGFPCGSGQRFNNVAAAGGAGVVLDSPRSVFDAGIAGNTTIPGVQLNNDSSDRLRPAAEAGTLAVRLDPDLIAATSAPSDALDTLNTSSSRGVHGSEGIVKPDVAAPGTMIGSAAVGTGDAPAAMTGTSMATPHVAGIAALVAASGDYTPAEIKARVMNTAAADVRDADGDVYGPQRVGSGRVMAASALSTPAIAFDAERPELTSVTFGVIEAGDDRYTATRDVTVRNDSDEAVTYGAAYAAATSMPGVEYRLSDDSVTVPAGGEATLSITLRVDPEELAKTQDPTMERTHLGVPRAWLADATGWIKLTAADRPELRVPVQAAPKPTSALGLGDGVVSPRTKTATLTLEGRDLLQGEGAEQYRSLLSAFELGAESGRLPASADEVPGAREMDLQYAGALSTVPTAGRDEGVVSFGVSTWGTWAHLAGGTAIEVLIDTDGDREADFVTFTANIPDADLDLVATYDLATGTQVDLRGLNDVFGGVDTNTFDTNVASLPVSFSALGVDPERDSAPMAYQVSTYSWYNTDAAGNMVPVDSTDWIRFNPLKPDVFFPNGGTVNTAQEGQTLTARVKKPSGDKALVLYYHNATGDLSGGNGDGGRAEVVEFTKAKGRK